MEHLRAFMTITALKDVELDFKYYPEDVETNSDTIETIIENGFYIALSSQQDVERALNVIKEQNSIETYEVMENALLSRKRLKRRLRKLRPHTMRRLPSPLQRSLHHLPRRHRPRLLPKHHRPKSPLRRLR